MKAVEATGGSYGGLYHLKIPGMSMKVSMDRHKQNCQNQWHRGMGNRDSTAVERIIIEQLGTVMKAIDCGLKLFCECCLEGKVTRAPFPAVIVHKSYQVLDIVHTDLRGPMKTMSPRANSLVNLVDDFSRFIMIYL